MGGADTAGQLGVYGSLGVASATNVPGARDSAVSWSDASGNLWLLGGEQESGGTPDFNDLWEFNPTTKEWTWISGSNTTGASGVFGTKGVPSATNVPPASGLGAVGWIDHSGNLWQFGGYGDGGDKNALWKFNPTNKEWIWISGSSIANAAGVYGSVGVASTSNTPGAGDSGVSWTDLNGNLWLFGGYSVDQTEAGGGLWEFNPITTEWTLVSGSTFSNYGTQGVHVASNNPGGGREGSVSWTDPSGNFWLFGGQDDPNDLWEFSTTTEEWTWVSGENGICTQAGVCGPCTQPNCGNRGVYGMQGVAAATNIPGSRLGAVGWTDASGNLWLFGGLGMDSAGTFGELNDLWEFNPKTTMWTSISGSNIANTGGVYGTLGMPAASNSPGGRYGAVGWFDAKGDLWLFGGRTSTGELNDLWSYKPASASLPPAATPTLSLSTGTYTTTQTVTITDSTAGATIYYTTNGSTPNASSILYSGPINVSTTETVKAIAAATGYSQSAVATATYTITLGTPVASLSETTVYFGAAPLGGTSGTMTITLTNNGNAPLVLSGDPTITSPFTILDKSCTSRSSISVGSSCTVDMTLTPAAAGQVGGTLTFTDNASPSNQSVALGGAGLQPFHEYDSNPPVPTNFDVDPPISPGCSSLYYGCAITSTASVLTMIDATVTPASLDAFLISDTNDPGYEQFTDQSRPDYCNLNWSAIPSFESAHSGGAVKIQMVDSSAQTNQTIQSYLTTHLVQKQQMVVIQLHYQASDGNAGTHYIAALGPTDSKFDDWYVVDPGWPPSAIVCPSGSPSCFTTLSGHLNSAGFTLNLAKGAVTITFNVTAAITYSLTGVSGRLVAIADSPVELLVTDPQSNQLGNLPNGSDVFNIPMGSYFREYPIANDAGTGPALGDPSGRKILYIPAEMGGTYNLTATGTASGPYILRFAGVATDGSIQSTTLSGTAFTGSTSRYLISYSSTPGVPFTVTPFATPTVTVTPSASSISTAQPLTVTVAVSGGTGNPTPTGSVALNGGGYASAATALNSGSATFNIPAGALATAADTLTATYTPDSASSTIYNSASNTATITVTTVPPNFALSGTAVTVAPGATTGNLSTITVTPSGGFTGSVALTAALTSSPAGAQYPPTLSFGSTSPVSITSTSAGTATLTVSTTAATSAALAYPKSRNVPWYAAGGTLLAGLLLFGIPARRRSWRTMLGMLCLLVGFGGGVLACGGSGGGGGGDGSGNPGTTAGTYTVTVTGTSGSLTQTTTLTVTVN
jgi:hypothetical protein